MPPGRYENTRFSYHCYSDPYTVPLARTVQGQRDIQTKVMTTLVALFAEVERDLISERTPPQGLAQARPWGRKLGRPKGSLGVSRLNGKEDEIRRFLQMGVPKTAIAKITGVSRTTLRSGPSRPVPPFLGELRWRRLRWPPHPDLQIMYRCKDLRRLSFSS